jgi:hypothetical protein
MCKRFIPCLVVFLLPLFYSQTLFAQKTSPIKCVTCHKSPAKILPASHKAYKLENTAPCLGCHKPEGKAKPLGEKIHTTHLQKPGNAMKNCFACHTATKGGEVSFSSYPEMKGARDRMPAIFPFFASWMTSSFLDQGHQQKGIYCTGCHKNYVDEYEATDTQAQCVTCHGDSDEMIKKTANTKYENNPHKSHFVDLKCSACHHSHKEFEDYCAKCHSFDYKPPQRK